MAQTDVHRTRRRRRTARRLGLTLLVLLLVAMVGAVVATRVMRIPDPLTLARLEVTAPSRQGDLFASRTIPASSRPIAFAAGEPALPDDVPWKGGRISLEEFLDTTHTNALVILQDGRLVTEWYAPDITRTTRMSSWSVVKSVVSLLIGQAIGRGDLEEDDLLVELLPELRSGGEYDDVTVRDLLDMTSGVDVPENYNPYWPFTGTARMFLTTDLTGFVQDHRTVEFAPGSQAAYRSVNTQLLGMILTEVEGEPLSDLLSERLWEPIGAQHSATWNLDTADGIEKGFCCLNATALDFAHLGQLVLDRGRVGDQRVVPAAWIRRLATPAEHKIDDWGYSAQWWHLPGGLSDDYSAIGVYGQYVYVNPRTHTVVVKLSDHGTEQDEQDTMDVFRALAGEDPTRPEPQG